MAFELSALPYGHDALEPYIDAKTMELHHDKHHATYVEKLNSALKDYPELLEKPIDELVKDLNSAPEEVRTAVKNHGGGHFNHSLFWQLMKKGGGGEPVSTGNLSVAEMIKRDFGSFADFKDKFSVAALGVFGSGWAWLVISAGKLSIVTTPNQENPYSSGQKPLLGLDVWEHAYYLNYQSQRAKYIEAWWNVVNWEQVDKYLKDPSQFPYSGKVIIE
ncbi:MAG: superoxide dismutase [Patescibacteria group bacterium]